MCIKFIFIKTVTVLSLWQSTCESCPIKTPKREIETARYRLQDYKERYMAMKTADKLTTWEELRQELFTQQEIAESNLRVALIGELIKARNEQNISQRELGDLSGVKQPSIARVENMNTDPRLHTLIKLLLPLGKTLAIVPLEKPTHISYIKNNSLIFKVFCL